MDINHFSFKLLHFTDKTSKKITKYIKEIFSWIEQNKYSNFRIELNKDIYFNHERAIGTKRGLTHGNCIVNFTIIDKSMREKPSKYLDQILKFYEVFNSLLEKTHKLPQYDEEFMSVSDLTIGYQFMSYITEDPLNLKVLKQSIKNQKITSKR